MTSGNDHLVSIIVPCFNYGHLLPETLRSVKEQSYGSWECIIIDDGSVDRTQKIASLFIKEDPRFKYIYQDNRGLSAARNTGIREAKGDFFQFLDADDLLEWRKLEIHAHYLQRHPEVDIVYGEARFFSSENPGERLLSMWGDNKPWMPKISGSGIEVLESLLKGNIMVVSSPLVCRRVFLTSGLFDESLDNHEDWDLWIRCALRDMTFAFVEHPETCTLIRYHPESMSRDRINMYETNIRIRERLQALLPNKALFKINKRMMRSMRLAIANEHIRTGKTYSGLLQLLRIPFNLNDVKAMLYGIKLLLSR